MRHAKGSVSELIGRFMAEMGTMEKPGVKPLGPSQYYSLRVIQRLPIGSKAASSLTKQDVIALARQLKEHGIGEGHKPLNPATISQYICFLSGVLKYAGSAWDDCENLDDGAVAAAKPFLQKHRYISKSTPRKRRPTDEEIERLLAYYSTPVTKGKVRTIRMPDMIAFALASSRRISEICRITHGDVDYENKVYWVRDLKHPTKKKGNDKKFVLWPELAEIIRRQPRVNAENPAERIFPFNAKSCSASYTLAKKRLGIIDLRFHDCRRDAISNWLKKMPPEDVRIAVSGHDNTRILETNYDGRDSLELLRDKYSALVQPNVQ